MNMWILIKNDFRLRIRHSKMDIQKKRCSSLLQDSNSCIFLPTSIRKKITLKKSPREIEIRMVR
jgi:hypothetical protein